MLVEGHRAPSAAGEGVTMGGPLDARLLEGLFGGREGHDGGRNATVKAHLGDDLYDLIPSAARVDPLMIHSLRSGCRTMTVSAAIVQRERVFRSTVGLA